MQSPYTGLVALYQVGMKRIVGVASIIETKLVTDVEMDEGFDMHRIPEWHTNEHVMKYKQRKGVHAWELGDVRSVEHIVVAMRSEVIWASLNEYFAMPAQQAARLSVEVGR